MATHVWDRVADGTAYYCAQCRMRVDTDEFSSEVEDSLCVPYVPTVAEHVVAVPASNEEAKSGSWPATQAFLDSPLEPSYFGIDPASPSGDFTSITFAGTPSLIEFVQAVGIADDLSEYQIAILKTFDANIDRKRRERGTPH